jgi:hypothetical protein
VATNGVPKAVEAVDREVAKLAGHTSVTDAPRLDGLRAAWGRLIELMTLGPPPTRRACPHCGSVGLLDAVRCARCRMELVPPPRSPT